MLKINDLDKTEELDREAMQAITGGFDLKAASRDGDLRITSSWYSKYLYDSGIIVH